MAAADVAATSVRDLKPPGTDLGWEVDGAGGGEDEPRVAPGCSMAPGTCDGEGDRMAAGCALGSVWGPLQNKQTNC